MRRLAAGSAAALQLSALLRGSAFLVFAHAPRWPAARRATAAAPGAASAPAPPGSLRRCTLLRARRQETRASEFFRRQLQPDDEGPSRSALDPSRPRVSVVACGVNNPLNIGSMLRLMACFGAEGELVVLTYGMSEAPVEERRNSTDSPGFFQQPAIAAQVAQTAKGALPLVGPVVTISIESFLEEDQASELPMVVLETAEGATSIRDFDFPPRCRVVVGSESRGVSQQLLRKLRRERGDAVVFVPMPGPYPSLNAGMSLACALYEYRRQWPG